MFEMCGVGWGVEASKLAIVSVSFALSAIFLILLKKISLSTKSKIFLIYSHILSLFFPFIFLTTNVGCASVCAACYSNIYQLLALALPTTLLVTTITGFFVIPTVFVYTNRRTEMKSGKIFNFVKKSSKQLRIKQPRVYILNKSNPVAFSFRNFKSAVFLSVGLFDILKWKEAQAVILHELAHIKQKSSAMKLSTFFLRIFSPLSILVRFHHNKLSEEVKADSLAAKIQGADKYIKSARNKIQEWADTEQILR